MFARCSAMDVLSDFLDCPILLSINFLLIFNRFAKDVRTIFDMFGRFSMAFGWFTGRCWLDVRWMFDRMSIHCQERFAVHSSPCYSAIFQNLALLSCYIPEWGLLVYRSTVQRSPCCSAIFQNGGSSYTDPRRLMKTTKHTIILSNAFYTIPHFEGAPTLGYAL